MRRFAPGLWLFACLLLLGPLACVPPSGGDGDGGQNADGGAGDGGSHDGGDGGEDLPPSFSLALDLESARAVATAASVSLALTDGRAMTGPPPRLFAIAEDGKVNPAMEAPAGYFLPPVTFVTRIEPTGVVLVAFERAILGPPAGGAETQSANYGSLFVVDEEGNATALLDPDGRIPVRRRDAVHGMLGENFEPIEPFRVDPQGRVYFVWEITKQVGTETHPRGGEVPVFETTRSLLRYDSAAGEVQTVVASPEEGPLNFRDFRLTADGTRLVVLGDLPLTAEQADVASRAFLRWYRVDQLDQPVDLLPSTKPHTYVIGIQLSEDGQTVFFNGFGIGNFSGVVRADIDAEGKVSWEPVFGGSVAFRPVNYEFLHNSNEDGLFDYFFSEETLRLRLRWADRWYVGGDPASGVLDMAAIRMRVAPYFTSEVEFSFGGLRGEAALAAFHAEEPYDWEEIFGFDYELPLDAPDLVGPHFLRTYFGRADSSAPAETVGDFAEDWTILAGWDDWMSITDIYFDSTGALWALVAARWNGTAYDLVQPIRLLDSTGNRAMIGYSAVHDDDLKTIAWRLDRTRTELICALHTPAPNPPGRGTHRLLRVSASDPGAALEDLFIHVPEDVTVLDFSVGAGAVYFVGHSAGTPVGGWISLADLSYSPIDGDVLLGTIEEL